jgi:NADH:ubiquinone oxidoreductase subunit
MKKLCGAIAVVGATLALAGSATANLSIGVNDDAAKDAGVSAWFYSTMQSVGLKINTLTVLWDEGSPTDIAGAGAIDQAIAKAKSNGVTIELDLYPAHSMAFTNGNKCAPSSDPESCGDTSRIQQFGAWAASVAKRFPSVNEFVVMNECNQPRFVNPQWDSLGNNQSAQICGRALAAAYDAIKAVGGSKFVFGVGLSPRGNDSPNAASNASTTPVTFLGALGSWFKAFAQKTGRTNAIMDGFDFHPYPVPQTQPFAQGYSNPKEASVTNLPRIYQAFYDAFNGSPQRTIGQQSGGGLPVSLNETGIQTDSTGHSGYTDTEVSAGSTGGVSGSFATEAYQASWYKQMLDLLSCDPNVQFVNIFHLIDEPSLIGWQSGLYYLDQSAKQSAQTVKDWIGQTGGNCPGTVHAWTPSGVSALATTTTTTTTTSKHKPKVTTTTSRAKPKVTTTTTTTSKTKPKVTTTTAKASTTTAKATTSKAKGKPKPKPKHK